MVLVDVDTAALGWTVTPRTIRNWIRNGKLRNYGRPGALRVDLYADVEKSRPGPKLPLAA